MGLRNCHAMHNANELNRRIRRVGTDFTRIELRVNGKAIICY